MKATEKYNPDILSIDILGSLQSFGSIENVVSKVVCNAQYQSGGFFCVSNTHQVVLGKESQEFRRVQESAHSSFSDSTVLAICGKVLGYPVSLDWSFRGFDLFEALLAQASNVGIKVGFYGGNEKTLALMVAKTRENYPALDVAWAYSPPFRPLTSDEIQAVVEDINSRELDLVFVGIGCPKQELFMGQISDFVPKTTMIGVGAAFDFYSGAVKPSPSWVHRCGFEWIYRLASEPRRLGRRYLEYNVKFIAYFIHQIFTRSFK